MNIIANKNLNEVQIKTKINYDTKAKDPNFVVGDQVMLKCMKVPKGFSPKLHAKWEGPFYITNVNQNNTYTLRRCLDHKLIKSRIHANRFKHYHDPRNHRDPPPNPNGQPDNNADPQGNNNDTPHNTDTNDAPVNADRNGHAMSQSVHIDQDNEDSDENDDNQCLAEKLLGNRKRNGKNYYRVKWVGYKANNLGP